MASNLEVDLAIEAAHKAAKTLHSHGSASKNVLTSLGKDIKTTADLAAEQQILEILYTTGLPILSEEKGPSRSFKLHDRMWIVDPLDGTFNFTRGFPASCISLALWVDMKPDLGVVYDLNHYTTYVGHVGQGATCNGQPVEVSKCVDKEKAVLGAGFPADRDYSDVALKAFINNIQRYKKIRMIGSAAMSLAHVSRGVFDAYFEEDIWLWDVAAGLALVTAAGGKYEMSQPTDAWKVTVYADNGTLAK